MRIVSVVGTRPHFIKLAPVIWAYNSGSFNFDHVTLHTGQHYDKEMSDIFLEELGIDTEIIYASNERKTVSFDELLKRTVLSLEDISPNCVLVYGDTLTTLAGSVASVTLEIPVVHIEAGLRCRGEALVEETIRRMVDHGSNLLFPPTEESRVNLVGEGLQTRTEFVGNLVAETFSRFRKTLSFDSINSSRDHILCTIHRQANVDQEPRLADLFSKLAMSGHNITLLAHPRLKKRILEFGIEVPANVFMREPVGYLEMLKLLESSKALITDSGGLQWEAHWLGIPFLLLREDTERPETLAGSGCFLDPNLVKLSTGWPSGVERGITQEGSTGVANSILQRLEVFVNEE